MKSLFYKSAKVNVSVCFLALIGLFVNPMSTQAQNDYPYYDAVTPKGAGTKQDPYQIEDMYHLLWMAVSVNSGQEMEERYFSQQKDIDLSSSHTWDNGKGWRPIGGFYYVMGLTKKVGFKGFYDGNGHKISNLMINRPDEMYQSLFGYVYEGKVTNVVIDNANVTGSENVGGLTGYVHDAEVSDCQVINSKVKAVDFYAGGVAGYQDKGLIANCMVDARVEGRDYVGGIVSWINEGAVEDCVTKGAVVGVPTEIKPARLTGGIAGYTLRSKIEMSVSYADVKGDEKSGGLFGTVSSSEVERCCVIANAVSGIIHVGGLVGENDNSVVKNCFARVNEVKGEQNIGGLIGTSSYSDSRVTNCYAVAKVVVEDDTFAGGLIGTKSTGIISGCYWNTEVSALDGVGGFYHEDVQCEGKTTDELKKQSTFVDWDFGEIWAFYEGQNDGYPMLKGINEGIASLNSVPKSSQVSLTKEADAYHVSALTDIQKVCLYDMAGNCLLQDAVNAKQYVLSLEKKNPFGVYLLQVYLTNGDLLCFKLR